MYNKLSDGLEGVGLVAIGRNEGERFRECLRSMPRGLPAVYVDSGSTDESVMHAETAGVQVVELCGTTKFSAARARNLGWRALLSRDPQLRYVQFLDGDCALDPGWLKDALAAIDMEDRTAVVFGQLKERYPERSLYNAMCDREWDVPVGEVRACGGNALVRTEALIQVGGYNELLIAGEEPDMCLRMKAKGWSIFRIPPKMATHDADILDFGSWWKRSKRSGHAYTEHVAIHKGCSNPDWVRAVGSMVVWALLIPGLLIAGVILSLIFNIFWLLLPIVAVLAVIIQYYRIKRRCLADGVIRPTAHGEAILSLVAKFAQFSGALTFGANLFLGRRAPIIEYKKPRLH